MRVRYGRSKSGESSMPTSGLLQAAAQDSHLLLGTAVPTSARRVTSFHHASTRKMPIELQYVGNGQFIPLSQVAARFSLRLLRRDWPRALNATQADYSNASPNWFNKWAKSEPEAGRHEGIFAQRCRIHESVPGIDFRTRFGASKRCHSARRFRS